MKWGVRRYQNKDGSLTSKGYEHYYGGKKRKNRSSNKIINSKKIMNQPVGEIPEELVQIGVEMASALAVYATMYGALYSANNSRQKKTLKNLYKNRDCKTINDIPRLKHSMKPEENMKLVNPDYPSPGSRNNCMLCTTAMVMREKGYDVRANLSDNGFYNKPIDNMFGKEGKLRRIKAKTGKDVINKLSSEGDGAYGNLCVQWKLGGRHSIFWKNIDGKTHIYDGQSGVEYDVSSPNTSTLLNSIIPRNTDYSRLDNVEPTDYVLAAISKRK